MKVIDPAQRIRRWHTYLVVWAVHRVLGLGFGALIVLASATGGLLVMHHELERVFERERHTLAAPARGTRLPVTALVRAVEPHAPPSYRPFRYLPADHAGGTDKVLFVSADGRGTRWSAFVDPHTAEVLWHGPDTRLFTPWLLALHMHLHVGGWGYVVTGLAGAGLVLLGATGLYLHRDRLRSLLRNPLRRTRSARLTFSDLHKWLGVASIYFSLILGLTGLIYCATIVPNQLAVPKPLTAAFEFDRLAPVEPMLELARQRFPAGDIQRVAFPTTARAPVTILVLERGAPVWRKFSRIEFDPPTGAVRAIRDARDATPREKFAAMLAPLHMGFHGSALVKWLYVIGGFAPALLAMSGATIWWLRTRSTRQRRSGPSVAEPVAGAGSAAGR